MGAMTEEKPRVLVVDDEPTITELVGLALRYEGFEVEVAADGRTALERAVSARPDLVVLDVMLPDLDGFEVVRRLRQDGHGVPVLFLTARDDVDDRVRGLTLGGDDYLTKPFSVAEMVARAQALLRRSGRREPDGRVLRFADLQLDEDACEVRRGEDVVNLTPTEYRLLRYFLLNPRRVLSKAQILDHVWEYDFDGDANVVETYVSYLRRKIDRVEPHLLHTVRGMGYALRLPR